MTTRLTKIQNSSSAKSNKFVLNKYSQVTVLNRSNKNLKTTVMNNSIETDSKDENSFVEILKLFKTDLLSTIRNFTTSLLLSNSRKTSDLSVPVIAKTNTTTNLITHFKTPAPYVEYVKNFIKNGASNLCFNVKTIFFTIVLFISL